MQGLKWPRRIIAILFIACIGTFCFANLYFQWDELGDGIRAISPPRTADDVAGAINQVEAVIDDSSYRKYDFIELYSYMQVILGKEESGNFDIIKSTNGFLNYGDFYHEITDNIEEYALRVYRLKEYAAGHGCEVIYINTVPLHTAGYDIYTAGIPYQDTGPDEDAMLFYLQSLDVDYLDVREVLRQSGLEPEEYRYKTDHHWTVEAGFETFGALVRKLENEYGESLDPDALHTSSGSYEYITYEDSFVGTLSRRAGIPFSGVDDFTLILPKFETSFYVEEDLGDETQAREGNYLETIIDTRYLGSGDPYNESLYTAYLGGSVPYRHIENRYNTDGLKVLFIHDSMSLPTASFLSPAVSELDMIWPLSWEMYGYNLDVDEYLEAHIDEYDYIFVELVPGNYTDVGFSFMEAAK